MDADVRRRCEAVGFNMVFEGPLTVNDTKRIEAGLRENQMSRESMSEYPFNQRKISTKKVRIIRLNEEKQD